MSEVIFLGRRMDCVRICQSSPNRGGAFFVGQPLAGGGGNGSRGEDLAASRQYLDRLAATAGGEREANDRCSAQDWHRFSLKYAGGKAIYESYTDEELLAILRQAAQRLGYSPAQKDIFCVLRSYIKHRFQKWPYALHKAGLRGLAGKGGQGDDPEGGPIEPEYAALLHQVAAKAEELGYPPTKRDLPEIAGALKQRFGSWPAVLRAMELAENHEWQEPVQLIEDLEPEYRELLQLVVNKARELGRTPLKPEVDADVRFRLRERCGSWRNVLYQAGLKPLAGEALTQAKADYEQRQRLEEGLLYRIEHLEPEYQEMLEQVRHQAQSLGRSPLKEEVDRAVRQRLQERCGSWRNALYQLGLEALSKQEAAAVKKQLRDKIKKEAAKRRVQNEKGHERIITRVLRDDS